MAASLDEKEQIWGKPAAARIRAMITKVFNYPPLSRQETEEMLRKFFPLSTEKEITEAVDAVGFV